MPETTMPERGAPPEPACPVEELLSHTGPGGKLVLTREQEQRMRESAAALSRIAQERPVYGLTRGFGPLVEYSADEDPREQGIGLLDHLTTGQGAPLPRDVVRTMVWLRLRGMTLGHSGVDAEVWQALAEQWNHGFTPVVPQEGSLSASGDLVPLAHAAQAAAGRGEVWLERGGEQRRVPADEALAEAGLPAVRWDARSALAFANGSGTSLARALHNHVRLAALARALASATGRAAALLGCNTEAYSDALSAVRGHQGQRTAAELIRDELLRGTATGTGTGRPGTPPRRLQEPYSLRCAPQVVGAVLDQLAAQGRILAAEAEGCTDNPVLVGDEVLHGGNFHAAPVGLASEQHALCVHQLAFLAERQLALVLDPQHNGGRPPLLAEQPGRDSGFAGVQIAATAHLGALRQRGYPASFTPVPTNLGNQDHVPLALNSANAVAEMTERAWWIVSSLFLAVTRLGHLAGSGQYGSGPYADGTKTCTGTEDAPGGSALWARLDRDWPPLTRDRPLAGEVAAWARRIEAHYSGAAEAHGANDDDQEHTRCPA
ncbi:aromatic amino acid ammonia-lyase [Streptomyces marispadix]|uniref:Aromatic amino acid ammonia-lyase n=1 Tax=Streptomyces marispadix TaxID=2922868 RepID=A0ABS9T2A3_9ACTN|nr:aromatic amino acid ammonia-lyase [Streptomyces marispadix]MCH6162578.1 aromatic amino acid ammonia-lyase [Streptomyces marispadix]